MKASKVIALLNGRNYVVPEDIKYLKHDILRHRVIVTYEAQAENITSDQIINTIFESIPVP
jgi:MoxR-like ATPase